jgi:Putative adhesin
VKLALASLLVIVAASASAFAEEPTPAFMIERDDVQIQPHAKVKVKKVAIDNRLGDVTVVGHDDPGVVVHVVKRGPDAETIERLKVNLVTDPDGSITLGTALMAGNEARPLPARSIRIDVTLEVPRGAHIDVKAWNGKLAVTGVHAGAELRAHAADVAVTDVSGKVSTDVTRGNQKLTSVKGTVVAENTYGEVSLESVSGDSLAASVHEGQVIATRVKSRTVKLRTTFGDIHFTGELLAGGSYDLASYQGNVKVQLVRPAAKDKLALRLDAYARDGQIDSRLELADVTRPEAGRLQGTFGGSRRKPAVLSISSMAGNVSVGLMNE